MVEQLPNGRLRTLMAEAGFTGPELVRRINQAGAEAGLDLRYQRPSVAQWLSGGRPRTPVPELAAEVFTRALGRRITPAETGLTGHDGHGAQRGDLSAWWQRPAADVVADSARDQPVPPPFDIAALVVPRWPAQASYGTARPPSGPHRPDLEDVRSAEAMLALFASADSLLGGGTVRTTVGKYLRHSLAPWLAANTSSGVHRQLLVVASSVSYLCGFACFDDDLQGTAERHYLTALRLAAEAGTGAGYAVALRGLSIQAVHLGHHAAAVTLADGAVLAAGTGAPRRLQAFLLGQQAVAAAADGNRRDAVTALTAAEENLALAEGLPGPVGAYHQSAFSFQEAEVRAHAGDRAGAVRALRTSNRHRPVSERRSRAVVLARLTGLHLDVGQLDDACATTVDFLDTLPGVSSTRTRIARTALHARLTPHTEYPPVRALLTLFD
ncbi:MAG: hypothetical protein WBA97_10415 [Actinophytocola sp.]|uniref:hypothetical protein n=1 Tax=Actinophytocola sp. TaxID=1872138 RepID=UPI003C74385D